MQSVEKKVGSDVIGKENTGKYIIGRKDGGITM